MNRYLVISLLLLSGAIGQPGPAAADVILVPADHPTVQAAIDAAVTGDTVRVSPGTYAERIRYRGKEIIVESTDGPNVTILEGGQSGAVVQFLQGEGTGAVLQGFTITGGTGHAKGNKTYGGAVVGRDAFPTLRDNKIHGNTATFGGGIAFYRGHPIVEDCEIFDNVARYGGGIALIEGDPLVQDCHLHDNRITGLANEEAYGGGIYSRDASAVIQRNLLDQNDALHPGEDTIIARGGGLAITNAAGGTTIVEANEIRANRVCIGGGVWVEGPNVHIVDNDIHDNSLQDCGGGLEGGGGVFSAGGEEVVLFGNRITANRGGWFGGGVHGECRLVNCLLVLNEAMSGAGAHDVTRIASCTITANRLYTDLPDGGGIAGSPVVVNTILWGNFDFNYDPDDIAQLDSPFITYSIVGGGYPGEGNIDDDPLFAIASNGAHQLTLDSPCVDAGTNDAEGLPLVDLDGDPRIVDGDGDTTATVDIGADELRREIAVRFGNLARFTALQQRERTFDVLELNESIGDIERVVSVAEGDAIVLSLRNVGGNGKYLVHGNLGRPALETLTVLPAQIGTIGFPVVLPAGADPVVVFNTIGKPNVVGSSVYFGDPLVGLPPAPADLLDLPTGDATNLPTGTEITFQGVLVDPEADSNKGVSITNAVVLRVE